MPMSGFLKQLREKVGHDLLVLPSAAVVLYDQEMRVLMGRHADRDLWVLPGGLVEPGELPADGAVREVWEETGLLVELTGLLGVYGGPDLVISYPNGDRVSYIATVFRGRIVGGELCPDGDEILELRYFSLAELVKLPHAKWMDVALPSLFSVSAAVDFQRQSWKP